MYINIKNVEGEYYKLESIIVNRKEQVDSFISFFKAGYIDYIPGKHQISFVLPQGIAHSLGEWHATFLR